MQILEAEKRAIETLSDHEKQAYKLPRKINSLRLQTIADTYAEMGKEIISLLYKKPVKAIPIV